MTFSRFRPSAVALRRAMLHIVLGAVCLIGCSPAFEEDQGTGAKRCVQNYFRAIVDQDWSKAYATLDESSQRQWDEKQFAELAKKYRHELGFEPDQVFIRACEEHGAEARAHVVLTGPSTSKDGRSKDALVLRRSETGWHVVLPATFGQSKRS